MASVGTPGGGTATIEPDGRIRYVPLTDVVGTDTFGYTVSDGAGGTDDGTISVTITNVNDRPVAAPKAVTTAYQTAVPVTMSGSDVETCNLQFQVVTPPAHGTLGSPSNVLCVTLLPPYSDTSKITYTPAAGYSGADGFTYRVSDGTSWSDPAAVAITVTSPNLVHIADIDASKNIKSSSWATTLTFTVHKASHAVQNNATVTGTWSNGATGTATCKTGAAGTCKLSKSGLPRATTSVTFTVTGITVAGGAHDPTANHDPETDSNGTVIVIAQ